MALVNGWHRIHELGYDDLPEEDGRYWVVLRIGSGERLVGMAHFAENLHLIDDLVFNNEPGFYYFDPKRQEHRKMEGVTHWMPLPELPKE